MSINLKIAAHCQRKRLRLRLAAIGGTLFSNTPAARCRTATFHLLSRKSLYTFGCPSTVTTHPECGWTASYSGRICAEYPRPIPYNCDDPGDQCTRNDDAGDPTGTYCSQTRPCPPKSWIHLFRSQSYTYGAKCHRPDAYSLPDRQHLPCFPDIPDLLSKQRIQNV